MSDGAESAEILATIERASCLLQELGTPPPGLGAAAGLALRLAQAAGAATAALPFEAEPPDFAREHERLAAEAER